MALGRVRQKLSLIFTFLSQAPSDLLKKRQKTICIWPQKTYGNSSEKTRKNIKKSVKNTKFQKNSKNLKKVSKKGRNRSFHFLEVEKNHNKSPCKNHQKPCFPTISRFSLVTTHDFGVKTRKNTSINQYFPVNPHRN